jgi:AraC-type DNA-binding domain-containing proteins
MGTNKMKINRAKDTFNKSIPFKVYRIADSKVSTIEHTHDYMQIWYVQRGCCEHYANDRCHMLVKGNIFVLPPFAIHRIKIIPGEPIEIIGCEFLTDFASYHESMSDKGSGLFDFAYLEPFLVFMEVIRPRLQLTGKSQLKVEELMLEMYHEYCSENKYYEILIKSDLLKLLTIIAREYEVLEDSKSRELFERYREAITAAIRYVNEYFTSNIYIKDICKIAMMSQTYFTYLFKQITGFTFIRYVNNLRIGKAMEMLKEYNISITDICYAVGFNDIAYFNKVFKKETGLSPRQYRNSTIK